MVHQQGNRKSSRILIVDDSKYIRSTLRQFMEEQGCEVVEGENGLEAVKLFETENPDVVLMDCVMPEMDGISACRHIQELPRGKEIPVIMVTSLADESTVDKAFEAGAVDYITKPINFAVLRQRVGRILKAKHTKDSLDQAQAFAKAVVNYALDSIITVDSQQLIITFNPAASRCFGYHLSDIIGESINTIIPELFSKNIAESLQELSHSGRECYGKRKDGSTFPLEYSISRCQLGEQTLHILILRDISKRKRAEQALIESEERYRTLTENAYDLISELSLTGEFVYISPNYKEVLGYEGSELLGKQYANYIHPDDIPELEKALIKLIRKKPIDQIVLRVFQKNGDIRLFESTGKAYKTADGETRIVFVSRDITERKQYEDKLWHQAFHDALTGLPNRVLLKDRLKVEIAHANRNCHMVGVIFLDLDRFKIINDTLGHTAGDKLLQEIAKRLENSVRTVDAVARLGGDEFTILVTGLTKMEGIAKIANKILETVKQPLDIEGQQLYVTTSMGISIYPNDGKDVTTLLKNADAAMYLAKEKGRNNYQLYTASMNEKAFERLKMENNLRRALDQDEFVLYYQPRININTKEVIGMEALIRWQHPEKGLVPPNDFIPIVEETGLIVPIGEWVLRTACAQNKAWQEAGYPKVRVAVNISARQFQLQNFVETVTKALEETGLDPRWLELEITESVAMQNVEYTYDMLKRLQTMGIDLAIDDFGTGYSSLSYLKKFPINKLKIDKSFVEEISTNPDSAAIAQTVLVLGKSLKFGVVAEGVENQEQVDFLQGNDCEEMQGYLFGKPIPAEEFWDNRVKD